MAGNDETESSRLLAEKLESVLKDVSAFERNILELRFGLQDGQPKTLEEVAKLRGLTREQVRDIEAAALRKLRHPSRGPDAA